MHVLATELATLEEADAAVDLGQSPADIVVLSFSDSDLSALAAAWRQEADALPTLRLASLKRLKHPMSVDLYVESVVAQARLVIVRCLGGLDYWRYGLEHIADVARERGILFAALPGDDRADPRLASVSTLPPDRWRCSTASSARAGRRICGRRCAMPARLLGRDLAWTPPVPVGPVIRARPRRAGRAGGADRVLSRQPDGGGHRADHGADGGARPPGPGAARRRGEQPERPAGQAAS